VQPQGVPTPNCRVAGAQAWATGGPFDGPWVVLGGKPGYAMVAEITLGRCWPNLEGHYFWG